MQIYTKIIYIIFFNTFKNILSNKDKKKEILNIAFSNI